MWEALNKYLLNVMIEIQVSGTRGYWNPSFEVVCFWPEDVHVNTLPPSCGSQPDGPLQLSGSPASCVPESRLPGGSRSLRTDGKGQAWSQGPRT